MSRPSWHKYFMDIAEMVSSRSTCLRRQVGAVAVKDKKIVATGYNGSPAGVGHCEKRGCFREENNIPSGERHELCWAVHAEANVVAQAALHGDTLAGATVYVTVQPCVTCVKLLVSAGVTKVIYKGHYPDELALQIANEASLDLVKYKETM